MHRALERRYRRRLRGPALNYYRDGRDSVAWHADRELRELDDTIVAIVTLGTRRPFLLRPKGGGPSIDVAPGSGDVLVMGGAAQRGWEHAVPKTARPGPRISVVVPLDARAAREPAIRDGMRAWPATSSAPSSSRAASTR